MIQMHQRYQDEHPDIDFRAVTFEWGPPFYTKVAMSAAGGRAADVAVLHMSRLASMAPGRLLDPIDTDTLADFGIDENVLLPHVWNQGFHDGELYGLAFDTHPHIHYFNPEICEEAGLLDSDGRLVETHGVEEYLDMCRAVQEVTGDLALSLDTTYSWPFFWTMYRQQDAELTFFEDDFQIDDEAALNAFAVIHQLTEEGLTPRFTNNPGATAVLDNGQAGLLFQGNWEIPSFEDSGLPYSAGEAPDLFGNRRTRADAHCFVLPHQDDRDPERTRASLAYMAWMLRNSLIWSEGGGHIPAYQPVVESDEYQALEPHVHYAGAAENAEFEPDVWFSGSSSRLQSEAAAALNGLHTGSSNPEQALEQFKASLRTLVTTPSPV
ncbi:extracellular solute-binding protein [Spiractinospora alimapuensis]|nr:extracellular solute-binding protein [Spiractinospora alimapuensis]